MTSLRGLPGIAVLLLATALTLTLNDADARNAKPLARAPVPATAATAARDAALRELLAGRDARAAVAQALQAAEADAPAASKAVSSPSAFSTYADSLRRLDAALAATRGAASAKSVRASRSQLANALAGLQASRLLVDARIEQIDRLVAAPSMPDVARQRWRAQRARILATLARIDTASTESAAALARGDAAVPVDALTSIVADEARASAPAVYGANLPLYRPRLGAVAPTFAPVVVPAYANAEVEVMPIAEDSADSEDAPLSAPIVAKAAALGHDYTRIVDFVRSSVRTQWYAGAQKGAEATLRTQAGNDVDQASLLIALLRASGAPARYVRGVVDVPVADLAAMIGVRGDDVGRALVAAGVPNRPIVAGGRIAAYAIEHVFVSAYVPYANYRGTSADFDGRTWIPLAPALKPHAFVPAAGALARIAFASDAFVDQYLSAPQTIEPLDALRQQVGDALSQLSPPLAYADQLAHREVDAAPLELLPASLPYATEAVTGEFARLPESLRQHARIVVRSGSGEGDPVVFDRTLPVSRLADRRVTLSYQPASVDDGRIADRYGGLGGVPPYLVHLRPVLHVAGMPVAAGEGELEGGASHRVEITFDGPAGSAGAAQDVIAGGLAALVFDAQGDAPAEQGDDETLPGDSESNAARLLANFGARYLSTWDRADAELAGLVGVSVVRPFPSIAMVINQYRVDRIDGVADALVWRGVALDAALRPVEPVAQTANAAASNDWLALSALHGSALEHRVFEQQWAVDSVSADKGLALARQAGTPIVTLTQATGVSGVHQPQVVLDAIAAWLARGYVVDVPTDPVSYEDWSGAVWRVRSLPTGEAGYFIAGALAGGSTAMPPELWYFQDLVAWLSSPYGNLEPNEDPLAGVALSLDESSQYQEAVVGTELAKPLNAFVRDAEGRPVAGAQVTFRTVTGQAHLIDGNGQDVAVLVQPTNRSGVASVRLRLDRSAFELGIYRQEPDKPYPQWIGFNQVEVSAASNIGTLTSGLPYVAYSLPDVPARMKLIGATGAILNPGLSYNAFLAQVTDAYDNEISNLDIALSTITSYEQSSCAGSLVVPTRDARLFIPDTPGACPADEVQPSGVDCGAASASAVSRPLGVPFFLVPPTTARANVTVNGSAGPANASLALSTSPIYASCVYTTVTAAVGWGYTPVHGNVPMLGTSMVVIDAAQPGQVLPAPQRTDVFEGTLVEGDHSGVQWQRVSEQSGRHVTFSGTLQNGSLESWRAEGDHYLTYLRAGAEPGPIHGHIYASWNAQRVSVAGARRAATDNDYTFGWSVDIQAPDITPPQVPLTPFGVTDTQISINANVRPADYLAAPASVDMLQDDDVFRTCTTPLTSVDRITCNASRGLRIDTTKSYSARTVLNDGTPFRIESPGAPIAFGDQLLAGYGLLSHATPATPPGGGGSVDDELALVQGRYPTDLSIEDQVDIPTGYACAASVRFGYMLFRPATVTLAFHALDHAGNASPFATWTAIDGEQKQQGFSEVAIDPAHLRPGTYRFKLTLVGSDGHEEVKQGIAVRRSNRTDSLPLAHAFVKGVDVYSGGAVLSEQDIAVGGRGPGLKLVRTYASHSGNVQSPFGRGWSSDLDAQVKVDDCGTRIVTGAIGQGQRFARDSDDAGPDGTWRYHSLNGYHGTLIESASGYDLYGKDGTHQHFAQPDPGGPRLSYVEDTDGNRVGYSYDTSQGTPRVKRLLDSAGRSIDLTYTIQHVHRDLGGIPYDGSFPVVSDARGPGGLSIHYEYDDDANLVRSTRTDTTGLGQRVRAYSYVDKGFACQPDTDGVTRCHLLGWRMATSKDALDNAVRAYEYVPGRSVIPLADGGERYEPEQRVSKVTEPDHGETTFEYPEDRGRGSVTTDIHDARNKPSHYVLNRYGAAEAVTDPAGTTHTEWDLQHLEPHTVTDALGTTTTWTYDAAGNRTSETIVHPTAGTLTREWTYRPQADFDPPWIRDRVDVATDGNGHATQYRYDAHGHRTHTTRGGVSEQDGYAANGDHTSHTDGLGQVWLVRYDTWGTPRETEDPLHHVTSTQFDERGRKLSETDANGHRTTTTYDARDRVLTTTYPATEAGVAIQTTAYDDAHDTRTDTNPNGHATTSTFDAMGRLVRVQRHDGSDRTLTYDPNGNLIAETDFADPPNVTTHVYDDANRRTETHAPERRTTLTTYDALGHVTSETIGDGDTAALDARVTEYEYAHALYLRTLVRHRLDAGTNADERTGYDAVGNVTSIKDALQRETLRRYDERDRLVEEVAPLGKVTTTVYDDADRVKSQTLANPGYPDQVRTREYDAANRVTATVDAEGNRRTIGYDAKGNATSRSDARGNLTHVEYDARDRVLRETGPVDGQVTTYAYDLAGNRTQETWPNGNARTLGYDDLERHTTTTDSDGPVEAFTYTANDDVQTRTDANGHVTTNHYDGLRRLVQQDLPGIGGQARTLHKTYDVHGDVVSETDAGGHATTHAYDALGRRTSTTLPAIAGEPDAVLGFDYDLAGNLTSQTDARGNTTAFEYDDLNRKTKQTDPPTADAQGAPGAENGAFTQRWTYDAAGNALTQIDRRGITTATSYDRENRPLTVVRDGLTTSTRTYDEDGRVKTDTDALGRTITNTYDEAGRKVKEERPLGFVQSWTYEPIGDLKTETDPDGRTTTRAYTKRRYLESETNAANETTTYGYDGEGHRTSMRRPLGDAHTWTYSYDEGDRLVRVTDPVGAATGSSTTYGYDLDGNLTRQTDANGHTTTFEIDARHHRTGLTYPATSAGTATANWTWDPDGNIATHTTPNGKVLTSTFDALNRQTAESVAAPLATEIAQTQYHHDGNGNLIAIDETINGTTRHAARHYDAFDRLDADTDVHGKQLVYAYDAVGNRTQLASDAQTTLWSYNALNQNDAVTVPGQGTTTLAYYPSGKLHVLTRPDGSTSTTEYDDAGRIQSIIHAKAGSEIAHEAYDYDANGNRTEQREANGAVTGNVEQLTTYLYDEADRLTDTRTPDRSTHYVLDAIGNRTHETIRNAEDAVIGDSTLAYNPRSQLTTRDDQATGLHVDLAYDADGNTQTQTDASGTRTFTYDARDRLMTLEQPNAPPLSFDYQSDGLRIRKTQASQETRYRYDQQSLLAETNSLGNPLSRYHYSATQLISRTDAGSTPTQRHYLNDALNTPIALLTQDGAVNTRTKYDAWGEITSQQSASGAVTNNETDGTTADLSRTDQQPIGYTGYLTDPESGLYYAKARYYDPRIARFTTEDPEEGQAMQPPSLHRYLYAYANPTVYTDPNGRCVWDGCLLEGAALAGIIGWAGSVIHDEWTTGADFSTAATNPRNIRNGVAVSGIAASGGTLGIPATAGLVTLGAGTDVAVQMNLEGKAYDQVDYERAVANGGITAGGGAVLGVGLGSANAYVSAGTKVVAGGLVVAGAAEGGQLIGEGLASGDYGKVALGTGFAGFSLAGGTAMPRMLSPRMSSAELDASLNALQPKIGAADAAVVVEAPAINPAAQAALPGKTVYVDSRGNAVVASADLSTNYRGERVVMPEGHRLGARDRGLDAPPIYRDGPFTAADRQAFLSGTAGSTRLAPHHRHQLPTSSGGVIDELRGPGHPQGNEHTGGTPNRHPNPSIFRRLEGGESLRGREIRDHWAQKGGRLIEIESGVWVDPGPGG